MVLTFLTPHARSDTIETALLLTSEIVTNALQHGLPPFVLHAKLNDGLIYVGVSDGSVATSPRRRDPGTDDQDGRGLTFLEALAQRWGTHRTEDSKTVWFELTNR